MKLKIRNVSRRRKAWSLFSCNGPTEFPVSVLAGLTVETIDQLLSSEFHNELRATRRILTGTDTTTVCDEGEEL